MHQVVCYCVIAPGVVNARTVRLWVSTDVSEDVFAQIQISNFGRNKVVAKFQIVEILAELPEYFWAADVHVAIEQVGVQGERVVLGKHLITHNNKEIYACINQTALLLFFLLFVLLHYHKGM